MAATRDSLVKEKIEEFQELEEESIKLRECYEFLEENPVIAEELLNPQFPEINFTSLSIVKLPTQSRDDVEIKNFNPTQMVKKLKSALERQEQAVTIENMRALIFHLIIEIENGMEGARLAIGSEISKELKPTDQLGHVLGFARKVLNRDPPFEGKAEDIILEIVNGTLKELLGIESGFHVVDYSAVLDLDKKISPLPCAYLECKSSAECANFITAHQELQERKYTREIQEQGIRYIIKGMVREAKAIAVPWEVLKYARYLKELTTDYFSDVAMWAWDEQVEAAQPMYNGLKESGLGFKACFISDFKYEFEALPSYDFVTVVPKESEKYYPRFLLLAEKLRNALKEGTFDAVDVALKDLSPEELKDSLTNCAIGGFFYFKQTIKHTDFGFMSRAVKKAIKALS